MSVKLYLCYNHLESEIKQIEDGIEAAGLEKPIRQYIFGLAGPNELGSV